MQKERINNLQEPHKLKKGESAVLIYYNYYAKPRFLTLFCLAIPDWSIARCLSK